MLNQTANMESFHSCQGLLFITFSSLIGTSILYTVSVVAGTCKQSQITWGCFPTFFRLTFFGMKWSPPPGGVVSCMIILFYTLCEETRVEHERPLALCCETGGYERRAGMSLGDKTIIMLNLCHALKAVPCECMHTLSQMHTCSSYRYVYTLFITFCAEKTTISVYLCCDQLKDSLKGWLSPWSKNAYFSSGLSAYLSI